jgi:CheY-like chemotaxis protein
MSKEAAPPGPNKTSRRREKDGLASDVQYSTTSTPLSDIGAHRRILLVDDNRVVLRAFETRLKADGFEVTSTPDAGSVANLAQKTRPELIILDMHFQRSEGMEWNGFAVIQWLRRFPELNTIPVIVVTGVEQPEIEEEALAAGAVACFRKPVRYEDLRGAILQALSPAPRAAG